jgi:hypothetical protein
MSLVARLVVLLASAASAVAMSAAPAEAEQATVEDRAGDASGPLDITSATFDNGDSHVVVVVSFDEVKRGDVALSIQPRGARGVTVGTFFRPGRPSRTFLRDGSFADGPGKRLQCSGLTSRWSQRTASVRVSMPARCLAHAEYGDLRFIVLTEDNHGGDSDVAPAHGDQFHPTRWIGRG